MPPTSGSPSSTAANWHTRGIWGAFPSVLIVLVLLFTLGAAAVLLCVAIQSLTLLQHAEGALSKSRTEWTGDATQRADDWKTFSAALDELKSVVHDSTAKVKMATTKLNATATQADKVSSQLLRIDESIGASFKYTLNDPIAKLTSSFRIQATQLGKIEEQLKRNSRGVYTAVIAMNAKPDSDATRYIQVLKDFFRSDPSRTLYQDCHQGLWLCCDQNLKEVIGFDMPYVDLQFAGGKGDDAIWTSNKSLDPAKTIFEPLNIAADSNAVKNCILILGNENTEPPPLEHGQAWKGLRIDVIRFLRSEQDDQAVVQKWTEFCRAHNGFAITVLNGNDEQSRKVALWQLKDILSRLAIPI